MHSLMWRTIHHTLFVTQKWNPESNFWKLIRDGGESSYFFSKFCFHLASNIFFDLLNNLAETNYEWFLPWQFLLARYTAKIQSWLTETRCLIFDCRQGLWNEAGRLCGIWRLRVSQSLDVSLSSNQAFCWRLSALKKKERMPHQRHRAELRLEDPQQRERRLNWHLKMQLKWCWSQRPSSWRPFWHAYIFLQHFDNGQLLCSEQLKLHLLFAFWSRVVKVADTDFILLEAQTVKRLCTWYK